MQLIRYRKLAVEQSINQMHEDELIYGYFQEENVPAHLHDGFSYLKYYSAERWSASVPDLAPFITTWLVLRE